MQTYKSILIKISMLALSILFFSLSPASAKWRPYNLSELVESSDLILIVEQESIVSQQKIRFGEKQLIKFKPLHVIKGITLPEIYVHGSHERICKAQFFFPDIPQKKYLLFLMKTKKNFYHVVNGPFGALPITDESVDWFIDIKSYDHKRQPKILKTVIEQINAIGVPSLSTLKPCEKLMVEFSSQGCFHFTAQIFEFSGTQVTIYDLVHEWSQKLNKRVVLEKQNLGIYDLSQNERHALDALFRYYDNGPQGLCTTTDTIKATLFRNNGTTVEKKYTDFSCSLGDRKDILNFQELKARLIKSLKKNIK